MNGWMSFWSGLVRFDSFDEVVLCILLGEKNLISFKGRFVAPATWFATPSPGILK